MRTRGSLPQYRKSSRHSRGSGEVMTGDRGHRDHRDQMNHRGTETQRQRCDVTSKVRFDGRRGAARAVGASRGSESNRTTPDSFPRHAPPARRAGNAGPPVESSVPLCLCGLSNLCGLDALRASTAALVIGLLAVFTLGVQRGEAHKPITSKYTYNDDVFPILKERCARCHVTGGVAPMSLMTYEEAFPWAESIRAELVTAHMPPAVVDEGFGDVVRAHALSPKDVDVILTWATGGNPRGAIDKKLPAVELRNEWTLGK